jgi:Ca2+-transporting ATPase
MRVLAIAYRQVPKLAKYTSGNTERSLVFVGLVAMEDPPRPEVSEAIALCQSAGIRVVMITGDSLPTAQAIAARIGLLGGKHGLYSDAQHEPLSGSQDVLDGAELGEMDDTQLSYALKSTAVFARATPEQKYRIVTAFMKSGEVVAVTGDGVNDSPALKKADIGVAMGITGTDVSKEVSEIVLTDDNFASIVSAIKYGRTVFNNIKSFVRYQLSTNVAALCLMFSAPLLGMPLPLLPVQILWINIMIDGPPALALGAEPPSNEEMKKKPRNSKAPFISQNLALSIVSIGVVMAAIALAVFSSYLSFSQEKAFTAVFTMFVFLQLFNALNCRSAQQSILSRPLSNLYIYAAIGVSLLLHLLIIYLPALQEIFKTVPLEPFDLAVIAGSAFLIVILEEIKKKFFPLATAY